MLQSTPKFPLGRYILHTPEYSIAESVELPSGGKMIGVTWNPEKTLRPSGYPNARGSQQWFILPLPLAKLVWANEEIIKQNPNALPF